MTVIVPIIAKAFLDVQRPLSVLKRSMAVLKRFLEIYDVPYISFAFLNILIVNDFDRFITVCDRW